MFLNNQECLNNPCASVLQSAALQLERNWGEHREFQIVIKMLGFTRKMLNNISFDRAQLSRYS